MCLPGGSFLCVRIKGDFVKIFMKSMKQMKKSSKFKYIKKCWTEAKTTSLCIAQMWTNTKRIWIVFTVTMKLKLYTIQLECCLLFSLKFSFFAIFLVYRYDHCCFDFKIYEIFCVQSVDVFSCSVNWVQRKEFVVGRIKSLDHLKNIPVQSATSVINAKQYCSTIYAQNIWIIVHSARYAAKIWVQRLCAIGTWKKS